MKEDKFEYNGRLYKWCIDRYNGMFTFRCKLPNSNLSWSINITNRENYSTGDLIEEVKLMISNQILLPDELTWFGWTFHPYIINCRIKNGFKLLTWQGSQKVHITNGANELIYIGKCHNFKELQEIESLLEINI